MAEHPNKVLLFFDESRFGTHSKLGHGWFPRGLRTQVKAKLGFENFYLYSTVNPQTGDDFTLVLPNVNAQCLSIFLEKLSHSIGNQEIVFVMDGAGWHKAKDLTVPANIELIILPPYSPELNPVERFWRFIKQHTIKNKVFESVADLEKEVSTFLQSLDPALIASLCKVEYL